LKTVVATPLMAAAAESPGRLGFTAEHAFRAREVMTALLALPEAARGAAHHRELTGARHTALRGGSRRVAESAAARFRECGLDCAGRTLAAPP
jgi:hypothetical protein